jgi:hypothetical protein
MTSERLCGNHPSARSPRTALQKGGCDPLELHTAGAAKPGFCCANAVSEPTTSMVRTGHARSLQSERCLRLRLKFMVAIPAHHTAKALAADLRRLTLISKVEASFDLVYQR